MNKLNIGSLAPDFTAKNQEDKSITLSSFKGKKVVLYFYPHDLTPGCTAQACNLRDNMDELLARDIVVIGVSEDPIKKHQRFIDKYDLNFDLIADEDHTVLNLYGVWGPKKFMGKEYDGTNRTTFIIDEQGKIEHIIDKVKTKDHTQQIIDLLDG